MRAVGVLLRSELRMCCCGGGMGGVGGGFPWGIWPAQRRHLLVPDGTARPALPPQLPTKNEGSEAPGGNCSPRSGDDSVSLGSRLLPRSCSTDAVRSTHKSVRRRKCRSLAANLQDLESGRDGSLMQW